MNNEELFYNYLTKCVKTAHRTPQNPLFMAANAPKDYVRFLKSDRLFDYNPHLWDGVNMYDISDPNEAYEIFTKLMNDNDFQARDSSNNQGWRSGAISHYVCFLNALQLFSPKTDIIIPDYLPLSQHIILGSLQKIVYGAPGTGKSHGIDEITNKLPKESVFRTTFHPDSDYSTFVGCYKPTKRTHESILSVSQAIEKLKEYKSDSEVYPCQRFATKYWNTIREFSTEQQKVILKACEFTDSMTAEFGKGAAIGEFYYNDMIGTITYEFVPQAFTKAFCRAYEVPEKPVFLVIEEINRGNCAQIFGDIFQLLDRDESGRSTYPIKPDHDLEQYLVGRLGEKYNADEGMRLPSNLYIWATMNTSDQSLFPIDSAFKRRWDWQYVPIEKNKEKVADWTIKVGNGYSWWEFLEAINKEIFKTTHSEDKQLGCFFCKTSNKEINCETFINKVVFYLWNDVFKDYGFKNEIFNDKDVKDEKLTFAKFFKGDAEKKVEMFLQNLGLKAENEPVEEIIKTPEKSE